MHPVLIEIGAAVVHSYGFFLASAFAACIVFCLRQARRLGLDTSVVPGLFFWALLSFLLGARLTYVLIHPAHFLAHPLDSLMFWQGGLALPAGFLAGAAAAASYLKIRSLPVGIWANCLSPGLALGLAIGSLGCLGSPCSARLDALSTPPGTMADPDLLASLIAVPEPSDIAFVLAGLFTFGLLTVMKERPHRPWTLFGTLLVLYGLQGVVIESIWNMAPGLTAWLHSNQLVFLWVLGSGLLILSRRSA